jgi:type I restriction enzyme, R subunit
MSVESEFATRRDKIDVMLKESGWDVKNIFHAVLDVDTLQVDIVTISNNQKNYKNNKFADYLLLDSSGERPTSKNIDY